MNTHPPGWPLLVAVSARSLDWTGVLGAAGLALGTAALVTVLPARADAMVGSAAVLVLACGLAAIVDDDTYGTTAPAPTSQRRRVAARAALALPVLTLCLAGVVALVAGVGTGSQRALVATWVVLGVVAVAVAAVGVRGLADRPGPVAAAAVLAPAAMLAPLLPSAVAQFPVWDTTGERLGWALIASAVVIGWATRDPVRSPVRRWAPRTRGRPGQRSQPTRAGGDLPGNRAPQPGLRCHDVRRAGAPTGMEPGPMRHGRSYDAPTAHGTSPSERSCTHKSPAGTGEV